MRSALVVTALTAVVLSQAAVAQTGGGRQGGRGGGRGTPIAAGESCPPGTTEIRPRSCMAPEFEPPSILDYRPHSTLVVPVHMVKTAKYPAIDFHGHPGMGRLTPDSLGPLGNALDGLNVRMMVAADNMSGERSQRANRVHRVPLRTQGAQPVEPIHRAGHRPRPAPRARLSHRL